MTRRFTLLLALFSLLSSWVSAQAVNADTIDFTKIPIFPNLRTCLQSCFSGSYYIGYYEGCSTNACLCRGSTLGDAVVKIQSIALERCSNLDDQSTAVSVLTAYCASKGYTQIVTPTILQTGASTVTVTRTVAAVTVATATVTTVIRVSAAAPKPPPPAIWGSVWTILVLAAPTLASFVWLRVASRQVLSGGFPYRGGE
jgi:hypothetical protein